MSGQFDLFGDSCGSRTEPLVASAAVASPVTAIARLLPAHLRLGTSSWSFPGWQGLVYRGRYPEATLARYGLPAYAEHPLLRAVGLDRTFYAPLGASEYRAYAEQVPTDFRFVVKAPAVVTTPPERLRGDARTARFLDSAYLSDALLGPAYEGLGERLGVILLQFPPLGARRSRRAGEFAAQLEAFLSGLPTDLSIAVELRDAELLTRDYAQALDAVGAVHCFNLHPRMPPVGRQLEAIGKIADPCIVRWMLHPSQSYEAARERYRPFGRLIDPDPAGRAAVADLCARALSGSAEVCVIANNKAEGCAPQTLLELARTLADRVPASRDP
jgi:uncharacterized protein YecE (DUF72 family)